MQINNFGSVIGSQTINNPPRIKWTISNAKKEVIKTHISFSEGEAKDLASRTLGVYKKGYFATVFVYPIKCVKKFGGDWVDTL